MPNLVSRSVAPQHSVAPQKVYALFSLQEVEHALSLARALEGRGVALLATEGTRKKFSQHGIACLSISEYTGVGELAQGQVKTLHPRILGGILGKRDKDTERLPDGTPVFPIDYVVVQPYPFSERKQKMAQSRGEVSSAASSSSSPNEEDTLLSYIDIGGIAMLRAAAKSYRHVCALYERQDFEEVASLLLKNTQSVDTQSVNPQSVAPHSSIESIDEERRRAFASKVFRLTAHNDATIGEWLSGSIAGNSSYTPSDEPLPAPRNARLERALPLRYGENPHQAAALFAYEQLVAPSAEFQPDKPTLDGRTPSYNNLLDSYKAARAVLRQASPACAIVKHGNLCGFARSEELLQAFTLAYRGDSLSAYGGVVAFNRPCDESVLEALRKHFFTLITAPSFASSAQDTMATKSLPPLLLPYPRVAYEAEATCEVRSLGEHLRLLQTPHNRVMSLDDLAHQSVKEPSAVQKEGLLFAFEAASAMTSNAIAIVAVGKNEAEKATYATLGLGCGQTSRIDAVEVALMKARRAGHVLEGCVAASDGFFPFPDTLEALAKAGIVAILKPCEGKNYGEVLERADALGIILCSTGGLRTFAH